jgi:hypothetical protein
LKEELRAQVREAFFVQAAGKGRLHMEEVGLPAGSAPHAEQA